MMEGMPESAEMNLLGAENIIENVVGMDNEYMKTTYRYLNNLYARWKKPEKAIKYRDKFLGVRRSQFLSKKQNSFNHCNFCNSCPQKNSCIFVLYDLQFRWCATETCDARGPWSFMRKLHCNIRLQ